MNTIALKPQTKYHTKENNTIKSPQNKHNSIKLHSTDKQSEQNWMKKRKTNAREIRREANKNRYLTTILRSVRLAFNNVQQEFKIV